MDELTPLVAGDDVIGWGEFWESLTPLWRRILSGSDDPQPPPPEPILRRHRLTTDYAFAGSFEPVRWLPSVTEALLWEDNGMDLGPLTGRSWELLQLAGPAGVDLGQLSGTSVRRLILSNVDVGSLEDLRGIPGLESLTLAHGDYGSLPPLEHLTELVLYAEGNVDLPSTPHARLWVTRYDETYFAPFGPDDV